jgi:hypothetical protein
VFTATEEAAALQNMKHSTRTILREELDKVTLKLGPGCSNVVCVFAMFDI